MKNKPERFFDFCERLDPFQKPKYNLFDFLIKFGVFNFMSGSVKNKNEKRDNAKKYPVYNSRVLELLLLSDYILNDPGFLKKFEFINMNDEIDQKGQSQTDKIDGAFGNHCSKPLL